MAFGSSSTSPPLSSFQSSIILAENSVHTCNRCQTERLSCHHSISSSAGFPRERLPFRVHFAQRGLCSKVTLCYVAFNILRTKNFLTRNFSHDTSFCKHSRCCCRIETHLPTEVPVPGLPSPGSVFWSWRNCIPANTAFAVRYWLSFSGSWRQAELLFIDLLSVSLVQCSQFWHTVLVIWSAVLLLNAGLGLGLCREGDSCQIQIVGYRSWLLKPTHSFLLQIIAHSLKPCFTVRRLAGKRSTYCISKVSQWDKG